MNSADYRGTVIMIVAVVATAANVSVMSKRLKNNCRCSRKYLRLREILNKNANRKRKSQQFVRKKKIDDKKYYAEIKELRYLLDEAYQQMQQGQYRYAIYDADSVMRQAIKIMLRYKNEGYVLDDLLMNMKICERKKLFGTDKDFINRLHEVYYICECGGRKFDKGKYLNHRKVYFVIMQLKDLLNFVEQDMIYS